MACKVVLITNLIAPYKVPLLSSLAREQDINLRVVCLARGQSNREWRLSKNSFEFDYSFLPGWNTFIRKYELPIHINWGVFGDLRRQRPDVVIVTGYNTLAFWQAALYSRLFRKPYILWNETTLLSTSQIRGPVGRMKRLFIRGADQCFAAGTKAAEYLDAFGASSERIHMVPNTVDVDWFRDEVYRERNSKNFVECRANYPNYLFLYTGQMIERKGVKIILEALKRADDPEMGLLVVGSGPQEDELKELCRQYKLKNVYFEGLHIHHVASSS